MDCPKCGVRLARDQYENAAVYLCTSCSGYLVKRNRLLLIKQSRERSEEVLKQEAAQQSAEDTQEILRCPHCRAVKMRKERVRVEPEGEFLLDVCKKCDHVWFDGGELARWQLDHEAGESAREAEEFRRRVESRTPAEQAALERRLGEAPERASIIESALFEAAVMGICLAALLMTGGAFLLGYSLGAALASVVFCLSLGWLLVHHTHTQGGLITGLAAMGVLELGFLSLLAYQTFF